MSAERTTRRDCEALVERLKDHLIGQGEIDEGDVRRIYLSRESNVYRLRFVLPGGGESDLSPGMLTAREVWLYLKGMLDGCGVVAQVEYLLERDAAMGPNA